jgi:hypothetical protein
MLRQAFEYSQTQGQQRTEHGVEATTTSFRNTYFRSINVANKELAEHGPKQQQEYRLKKSTSLRTFCENAKAHHTRPQSASNAWGRHKSIGRDPFLFVGAQTGVDRTESLRDKSCWSVKPGLLHQAEHHHKSKQRLSKKGLAVRLRVFMNCIHIVPGTNLAALLYV